MTQFMRTLRSFSFSGRYSWVTNIFTGCALFVAGDAVEQKIEMRSDALQTFDRDRTTRSFTIGLIEGPPHIIFYKYLDRLYPATTLRSSSIKVLLDQLIACPFFNVQYLVGMSYLEGKPWPEVWSEFKKKFPTVVVVDWVFWPPIQFLNFLFVPAKYRVLYIYTATVVWNVFLSYMKHYDQHHPHSKSKQQESTKSL